jgi:hypothetical protein
MVRYMPCRQKSCADELLYSVEMVPRYGHSPLVSTFPPACPRHDERRGRCVRNPETPRRWVFRAGLAN